MNKSLQMRYYHALRKTNPALSKSKAGRSMIMMESIWMCECYLKYRYLFQLQM